MPSFTSADEILRERETVFTEIETLVKSDTFVPEDFDSKVRPLEAKADSLTKRYEQLIQIEAGRNAAVEHAKKTQPEHNTPSDNKFGSLGEYFVSVYKAGKDKVFDKRLTYFTEDGVSGKKDLNEGIGSDGGFLVPTEFRNTLLAVMTENNIIRNRATVIPMSRRELQIPVLDQTGTTEGVPHMFGGINVFWQAEASEKTQSEPNFRQINLVAHKLVGYTRASDELLADSAVSLQAFLTGRMGFAGAISWAEDYSFFNGNGVGQPLGVLNSDVTLSVPRTEQGDVIYEDLLNMQAKFYSPTNRGVWIASQSLKAKLMGLNGPAGFPQYLWGDATNGQPSTLLGYPIIFTLDQLPRNTATSEGDLMLADFSYYLIGDRQNTTIESTIYDRWRYDQTSWRAVHRVDGQAWLSAPITSVDGTTQVSPFVVLGAKTT